MTTTLCSVILEPIGGLGTQAIAMLVLNVEGTKEKKEQGRMKLDEDTEKLDPLDISDGNVKWFSPIGKQVGSFSKS